MTIAKPPFPMLNRAHHLCDGLEFAMPFHEGSGPNTYDVSGNDLVGTLTNMSPNADWVGGPHGTALDFDGTNDIVLVDGVTVGEPPFTVAVLAQATQTTGEQDLIGNGAASSKSGFLILQDSVSIQLYVKSQNNSLQKSALSAAGAITNEQQLFVGTWDGTNTANQVKLYVDGKIAAQGTATSNASSASNNLTIGGNSFGAAVPWQGTISLVLVYSRVLDANEIAELYYDPFAMLRVDQDITDAAAANSSTSAQTVGFFSMV